jgi:hypothetical protein
LVTESVRKTAAGVGKPLAGAVSGLAPLIALARTPTRRVDE